MEQELSGRQSKGNTMEIVYVNFDDVSLSIIILICANAVD